MKKLLFPVSFLWGCFMHLRRKYYNSKGRKSFDLPVICVGNLCMGGSGKTPHVEYLIRLLSMDRNVATLSRGYGRRSEGFLLADSRSTVYDVGDEPLSYYKKYPSVTVSVCEDRVAGINTLRSMLPETDVIILDDAYQHLSVKAGLNILLTDYYNIYPKDSVIPMGSLREWTSAASEADIIVITKTPKVMTVMDEALLRDLIKPLPHQRLYFSYIEFGNMIPLTEAAAQIPPDTIKSVVTLTGIANPYPLIEHLGSFYEKDFLTFPDHHQFTVKDIEKVKLSLDRLLTHNKVVITTEKDAMRLMCSDLIEYVKPLPLFYIPIEVRMHNNCKHAFDKQILDYVEKNK
ncbi:MAG: tetraacyldisaccharide 4'-kinase [Bacteroidales bacterium]|nr:tetraacyldisaccharide 4'-kinase [Bacteroidales bacterium]